MTINSLLPKLLPRVTEKSWFPINEEDEDDILTAQEEEFSKKLENIANVSAPVPIGVTTEENNSQPDNLCEIDEEDEFDEDESLGFEDEEFDYIEEDSLMLSQFQESDFANESGILQEWQDSASVEFSESASIQFSDDFSIEVDDDAAFEET